jgi:hypothetical protein
MNPRRLQSDTIFSIRSFDLVSAIKKGGIFAEKSPVSRERKPLGRLFPLKKGWMC